MKISERNIFVRLYKYVHEKYPDNFCSLFWSSVFTCVFAVLLPLAAVCAVGILVLVILNFEWVFLLYALGILLGIAALAGIIYLVVVLTPERVFTAISNGSDRVADVVAVIKNKYCPRLIIVPAKQLQTLAH